MTSPILAFSAAQVCRLTGLTERQLSYWDRTGFFPPQYAGGRRSAYGRVYSFRDVVGLRVLAILRNEYQIPLQVLRRVGAYLSSLARLPWSQLTLYVVGREVLYDDPATGVRMSAVRPGQTAIPIPMDRISAELAERAERLRSRQPHEIGKVVQNRYLVHNEPVVAGTRIPTKSIWNLHEAGYTDEQILHEYPSLTLADIAAAIEDVELREVRKAG